MRAPLAGRRPERRREKVLGEVAAVDKDLDAAFKEAIAQVLAFNSEGAAKVIMLPHRSAQSADADAAVETGRHAAKRAKDLPGQLPQGRRQPAHPDVYPGRGGGSAGRHVRHGHYALDRGAPARRRVGGPESG
ncbi:hypothetical protein LP419_33780 [Massilia sp. H-1]|nr:hypothetical protein LP419_33780 [Massilia sp. H-1]